MDDYNLSVTITRAPLDYVSVIIDNGLESAETILSPSDAYVFAHDLVACAQSVKYTDKDFPPIVREWRKERGYDD